MSCCHTDVFGCLGDFGITERALPHRVFGAQAILLLLLTLHKLFIMQQFYSSLLPLSPVWTIVCAQVNESSWAVLSPRLDGRLCQHFINPHRGLRRHSAGPLWPCYATTSECRALRSATLGPAWGREPCPASSSDRVINAEHINKLSRFHAQKISVLIFFRFDQASYFLVKNLFVTHKFKYPVYLGASFMKLFLLHMIILVRFVPCSCITPQYAPY